MEPAERPGALARGLARVVGVYQAWSANRPPRCRFVPSCSEYTKEAILEHGAARGVWLGTRRIVRCRPGGGFGADPVPDRHVHPAGAGSSVASQGEMTRVG